MNNHRAGRERELRRKLTDPVERIVLERKFFEVTKSLPPKQDDRLIQAILDHDDAGVI